MMADNKRDTELTIRVKDLGTKTFREVASSVGKITEALDKQVVAAERGEVSVNSLRNTIKQLKDANQDLVRQQGLVDFYQSLADKLKLAETKAASARKEFEAFNAQVKAGGEVTKQQAQKLGALEAAATRAEAGVVRATQRLSEQGDKLKAVGLDTANLAAAQQNLVTVNAAVDRSLKAATGAYENYDANLARTKAAEEALTAAQEARRNIALSAASKGDLGPLQAITDTLERQKIAVEALAAAEARRQAAQRAKSVRADLAFQTELEAAIERQTQAQKQLAAASELSGFQKIGEDALAAAGKMDVYSAAAGRAAPASSRIAASLNAILNPAQETVRTLGGLEAEISRVTAVIGDGKGSVHSYAEAFQDLDRIQRQVIKSAQNLDAYKDQARVVAQAQAAFEAAKGDVLRYGEAVRTASEPNAELAASLKQAEAAMNSAERELAQQITKLKGYGTALKEAGVDVTNLAAAEKRLADVANATAGATTKLNNAAAGKNGKIGSFLGLRPYELQNLAFQLNDVFTQIASGTSITQTFAQQGGQIVQLFPRLFASLIPLAPVILAVGAAVGVVVASMRQLFDLDTSQRQFAASLALSADGAKVQASALAESAHELDAYGGSLKDARKAVQTFLQEGLDPKRIVDFGKTAQDLADITGTKLPEAAEKLATSFTHGMEAIDKLDQEYNFLTETQRQQIKALFDEGKAAEARTLAYDIFREHARSGANEMRSDLTVAVRNLTEAWDGLLHNLGNILPIQDAANFISGLAATLRELTNLIPKARDAANNAKSGAGAVSPQAALSGFDVRAPFRFAGAGIDAISRLNRKSPADQDAEAKAKDLAGRIAKVFKVTGDVAEATSERAAKANARIIEGLRLQYTLTKNLTDAERIRASGLKALREAENLGASGKALDEAKKIGEEFARQEIAKEHARKSAAADRKASAAARKAEAEENRRIALQSQLMGDLRQIQAKADQQQTASLEDRLSAVDAQYAKIFETIDKLKKAGGTKIDGKSFVDFTAQVEAGKTLLKQQETLKFYTEQIKGIEDQRAQRLESIKDSVAAGTESAAQGFDDAKKVADELDPKIASIAQAAADFAISIRGATPDPKLEAFIDRMQKLAAAGGVNANRTNSPLAGVGKNLLDEQRSQLEALMQARDKVVANEKRLVDLGLRTSVDAQTNIRAAYAATTEQITTQTQAIADLATKMHEAGTLSDVAFQGLLTDLDLIRQGTQYVDENFTKIHDTIVNQLQTGISQAFDTIATAIGQAIDGTGSWEDALQSIGDAARQFAANFLKAIADILLQIAVLQAIKNIPFLNNLTTGVMDVAGLTAGAAALTAPATELLAGGTALTTGAGLLTAPATLLSGATVGMTAAAPLLTASGSIILTAATVLGASAAALQVAATTLLIANTAKTGVFHSGGVIGPGGGNRSRSVPAALFAGAPRYHDGTVVGLRHDEQAAILQNGEQVLSKSDPRNVLNANKQGNRPAGQAGSPMNVKVINTIDAGDFVAQGLDTAHGERAIMNFMRARKSALKQILG